MIVENSRLRMIICDALHVLPEKVSDIILLKKGMTNRSYSFVCGDEKYMIRIPGEGTEYLINRKQEAAVYKTIAQYHISDEVCYIDPATGIKITRFWDGARVCDPFVLEDVSMCIKKLRNMHEEKLRTDHMFDILGQIDFYEKLRRDKPSVYLDYEETKKHVLELKKYVEQFVISPVLTHIDAVCDNFLFISKKDGSEEIRLIDWEYAGMQDPHVDIAMFCIYACYDREWVDKVIDLYFTEDCKKEIRIKIYCYIAMGGLLWSNWCEYKRTLGIEFEEYARCQYQYAKDYYGIVQDEIGQMETDICIR